MLHHAGPETGPEVGGVVADGDFGAPAGSVLGPMNMDNQNLLGTPSFASRFRALIRPTNCSRNLVAEQRPK